MACHFITAHNNDQSDLVLLAVNTLLKDCSDANPMVRGLALRTLCSLCQDLVVEYCMKPITSGLKDRSAYVRRVAVMGCVKVHQVAPQACHDYGLINELYKTIRDSDPIVMVNCLNALEEILISEGGIIINKNIAHHLLNRLPSLTDWGVVVAFQFLKRHRPKTEDETFDCMNVIDSYVKHSNCSVVIACLQLFLHFVKELPHLHNEVYNRAKGQILHFLTTDNYELVYSLLDFLSGLISSKKSLFEDHYKVFFCRYNEPLSVKVLKLKLITELMNDENSSDILDDLRMHCTDISTDVTRSAISAIGKIYTNMPSQRDKCIKIFLDLINLKTDYITSIILDVLKTLNLKETTSRENLDNIMSCIPDLVEQTNNAEGSCALLWLIGEYGSHLDESSYILEGFVDRIQDEQNSNLWLHLLTACMKQFFVKPAECQDMLGALLELCIHSESVDIRDRAVFYYRLLKSDINNARNILCRSW